MRELRASGIQWWDIGSLIRFLRNYVARDPGSTSESVLARAFLINRLSGSPRLSFDRDLNESVRVTMTASSPKEIDIRGDVTHLILVCSKYVYALFK